MLNFKLHNFFHTHMNEPLVYSGPSRFVPKRVLLVEVKLQACFHLFPKRNIEAVS